MEKDEGESDARRNPKESDKLELQVSWDQEQLSSKNSRNYGPREREEKKENRENKRMDS